MSEHDVFRVNGPKIIYENIDGELVLINMTKGTYYSTDKVGAEVWELVVAGRRVDEIRDHIGARYEGTDDDVIAGIAAFLEELRREELIVPGEAQANGSHPLAAPASKAPFQAPALTKYRDMEDMLLLDPIHEVEEAGWPAPKPAEVPESRKSPAAE